MNKRIPDVLFFADEIGAGRARLPADERHHAVNVLRMSTGDRIRCTNGKGVLCTGVISEITKHEVWVTTEHVEIASPPGCALHIAVAPVKQFSRMEWCLEKLTEIGVQSIIPVWCHRSERQKWNSERAEKALLNAMKQSRRLFLPDCPQPVTLSELLQQYNHDTMRYIACMREDTVDPLSHYTPGKDVLIVIGPEGDFTDEEIRQALDAGYVAMSLGDFRLRTETAAIVAATSIQLINQQHIK